MNVLIELEENKPVLDKLKNKLESIGDSLWPRQNKKTSRRIRS